MLPDYWLSAPPMQMTDAVRAAADHLLDTARAQNNIPRLDYDLPVPKWQFLTYLTDHHGLALHGSGNPNIAEFEPRQPHDLSEFGNQKAVYAAGDGIWPIFYAITDRNRYEMSINNACVRLIDAAGEVSPAHYVFSISQEMLSQQPWRTGVVYLLPKETFVQQPWMPFGPIQIQIPHLASLEPVSPIAKLKIAPDDFPFLTQIRGHDDARLQEYAMALQTGRPWPE